MYILHKVSIWINCLTVRTESSFESPLTPPRVGQILSSPTSLLLHFFDIDRVEGNKYETLKRGTWKVTSGGKDKRIDNVERKINHPTIALKRVYIPIVWMKSWSKTAEFHRSFRDRRRWVLLLFFHSNVDWFLTSETKLEGDEKRTNPPLDGKKFKTIRNDSAQSAFRFDAKSEICRKRLQGGEHGERETRLGGVDKIEFTDSPRSFFSF